MSPMKDKSSLPREMEKMKIANSDKQPLIEWTLQQQSSFSGKNSPIVLYSDLNSTGDHVGLGLSDGDISLVGVEEVTLSNKKKQDSSKRRRHEGASGVVCSKTHPQIVYSCSNKDGTVRCWDWRVEDKKSNVQIFSAASSGPPPPLLCLDTTATTLLCAGSELANEDSLLLFWDTRNPSNSSIGAYWESHSDDITAVKFHPEKPNVLASGSTDGLINIYDLNEGTEDGALKWSFNLEGSTVDTLQWTFSNRDSVACVTHCNRVSLWDADDRGDNGGDKVGEWSRKEIANVMGMDSDSVHVTRCFNSFGKNLGFFVSSSNSGGCGVVTVDKNKSLQLTGTFTNQKDIVKCAEFVDNDNSWITFDDLGVVGKWAIGEDDNTNGDNVSVTKRKRRE